MRGTPRPEGRGAAPWLRCCPAPRAVPLETSGPAAEGLAAHSAGGPSPELGVPAAPSVLGAWGGASSSSRSSSLLGAAFSRLR